jgi:uncharacterized membrane-anchored protein
MSQPRTYGGMGFGTIYTSALFLAIIVALVAYVTYLDHTSQARRRRGGSHPA